MQTLDAKVQLRVCQSNCVCLSLVCLAVLALICVDFSRGIIFPSVEATVAAATVATAAVATLLA
jgi:hypothetical protein